MEAQRTQQPLADASYYAAVAMSIRGLQPDAAAPSVATRRVDPAARPSIADMREDDDERTDSAAPAARRSPDAPGSNGEGWECARCGCCDWRVDSRQYGEIRRRVPLSALPPRDPDGGDARRLGKLRDSTGSLPGLGCIAKIQSMTTPTTPAEALEQNAPDRVATVGDRKPSCSIRRKIKSRPIGILPRAPPDAAARLAGLPADRPPGGGLVITPLRVVLGSNNGDAYLGTPPCSSSAAKRSSVRRVSDRRDVHAKVRRCVGFRRVRQLLGRR